MLEYLVNYGSELMFRKFLDFYNVDINKIDEKYLEIIFKNKVLYFKLLGFFRDYLKRN